ncbi:MAG: HAD hydrolase-like protein [Alphaproteobacteria bacterium]|nr:HAD hydrolase-like protein [Alphaproteobacteria bacterium]
MADTLILDLDGTLVDSVADLAAALNRLMAARGLAPFSEAETAAMVGDGVSRLLERAFAARGCGADEAAVGAFEADYGANLARASRLYPCVEPTLRCMAGRGWLLAVCTNKPEAMARQLLDRLGVGTLFAAIGGGDSFPTKKPDPAHVLATVARAGGLATRAVMAGDHANDVIAAAGAGIPCIFAAWGYGRAAMAEGAAAVAQGFADVPGLAQRLLRR